ncbi:hypothetical protein AVEN_269530-1 [Araneus ventricosus]|uniref:Gustatory receptor n=1 Tax=Araneus ventricosus TaxID=182803 RepID=A0A4Y2CDG8_ARAVE|nr:hypothetical protein AVEN_269530-1 [Araneus ventricosus]
MACCSKYSFLWFIIRILGIDVLNDKRSHDERNFLRKFCNKVIELLFPFVMYAILLYSILSWALLLKHKLATPEVMISFLTTSLISVALWHDIRKKRNLIKKLILKCQQVASHLQATNQNLNPVINSTLVLAILIPALLAAFYGLIESETSVEYKMYYSFFLLLEDDSVTSVSIRTMIIFFSFFLAFTLPSLIGILVCRLYYIVGELFEDLHAKIKTVLKANSHHNEILNLFEFYCMLYKVAHKIERAISLTTFLLLCCQWLNTYIVLVSFFKMHSASYTSTMYWESAYRLILSLLILVGIVLCACKISSHIQGIGKKLQLKLNTLESNAEGNHKSLQLVQTMLNMKFPQITAYGITVLNPSLILSFYGSILTYGLLMLNLREGN